MAAGNGGAGRDSGHGAVNVTDSLAAHTWRGLVPWWAWIGIGVIMGMFVAGIVLQLLVTLSLQNDVNRLTHEVCKLSLSDSYVIANCVKG